MEYKISGLPVVDDDERVVRCRWLIMLSFCLVCATTTWSCESDEVALPPYASIGVRSQQVPLNGSERRQCLLQQVC